MLVGVAIFQVFPAQLMAIFQSEDSTGEMVEIGSLALRIISIHFPLAAFGIVTSSSFQALGHGILSLIMSLVRQLCVLLPAALILSIVGGLNAVWFAFPIAELSAVILAAVFLRSLYRKEIKPLFNTDK